MSQLIPWPKGPKLKSITDAANVQLENLQHILENEGVTTYRPDKIDWS